jgi:FixJ family two-component response regulator
VSAQPSIAVVDDDQSLRTALVRLVRSLGYDVRAFASAEELLQSDAVGQLACVVSDIHMPGMSGIDLVRHLSKLQCTVPVILITARTEPGLEAAAAASGAVCFLRKPFEASMLSDCLRKALSRQADGTGE